MSTSSMKILCRYQYDPLDRLTGLRPAEHVGTQRFYQTDDLVNEIEGQIQLTILRHEAQPLAQRLSIANVAETTLLATDQQHSVLQTLTATDTRRLVYTAYGHQPAESGLSSLLGFNGERPDPITGHYLLGQGNRAFNPVLMRFNSPDELSPFGDGGINPYAYCGGDPVNRYDPSGNIPRALRLWITPPKIFRPWQPIALDLSSNPTSRTVSPKHLPFEIAPRSSRSKIGARTEQRAYEHSYLKDLADTARTYDRYRRAGIEMKIDPELLNKYYSAKRSLVLLQNQKLRKKVRTLEESNARKVSTKARNDAFAKAQRARWRVKEDAVKKYETDAGTIRAR
ncbi:RHS repeat-associated core domain-containing protein [Pseudomonas ogarae]|uniref:RHS repeat-associated core domain-containing protein n=1 Tax=Pseudomonas ogarae (strain DSM 112162 / CECT 30235 / F113) TaxID=1114970 RepID=UPI001F2587AB|nr:RHS repeat-associated core domain-containing protein [Pseudomonas ogarae]